MKTINFFIGALIALILSSCTLVKFQTYSRHGVLMSETIVKKNRKVIVRNFNTKNSKTFLAKDSLALYYDSSITSRTLYADSLMYEHFQYNKEHILTHHYKIKRYISYYEMSPSAGPVLVVYQLGKLLQYDDKGQKTSKSVYRFGWVKDVEYKKGKKSQVKRSRVKKLYKGIE